MAYDIAARARAKFAEKEWTQAVLARKTGMTQPHLWNVLHGKKPHVSADTVRRLAKALGCTTDYLLCMDEED